MKVSIITPLYNCSSFLEKTIQSVLSQTYHNWEMIMVDDCSKDNSLEIARLYAEQDKRIKLLQLEKNSGAAVARNKAIEAAIGRYIAFLDGDDLWMPDKLARQVDFMFNNNVAFSYTSYEKINQTGDVFGVVGVPDKLSYKELLKTNVIGCLTVAYDTKVLGKIYMPTNTRREDYATWLNILKKIDCAYGLPMPLAQYRVYANQTSGKKASMARENWRLYRDLEKLSILQASYYFSHYAFKGVLRTKFPRLAERLGVL